MTFEEYPDRDMMMMSLADTLASELRRVLQSRERATFCVPGGSTPGPVFDTLSAVHLDWDRVDVVLSDERWVPQDDPRSNSGLVRRRLLTGPAARARLVPLVLPDSTPEEALPVLTEGLRPLLPIALCLLGMGEDMHTASLIPGADRLEEALAPDAPPLMVLRAPSVPEPRITLTAQVLEKALFTHVVITGESKREALERAARLDATAAPIRRVLSGATVHWAK